MTPRALKVFRGPVSPRLIFVSSFCGSGVRRTFSSVNFQRAVGQYRLMLRLMMSMPEVRMLGSADRDLLAVLVRKLRETEAKHFALLVKDGGRRSLLEVALVDRTDSFSDDVVALVEGVLQTMASPVAWTERLQTQGRDPRIADVLGAPDRGKKRDHEDGCVASSTAARAFKPKMRVTWAPGSAGASRLSEVDRVCFDRWAKRATDLLREAYVPAWTLVKGERHSGPREDIEGSSGEIPDRYYAAASTFLGGFYMVADVAEGETLAWKRSGRGRLCRREDV